MQLTHKISGVSLIMFAVLAFSGFFVTASADENKQWNSEHNDWNDQSCEIRHDSWQTGRDGNWENDGWWWDAEYGYWENCADDSDSNSGNHDEWKDDNNDGRCDWDGKDWDTWHRDNNKKDWNDRDNKDWDKKDDKHDHDWKDNDWKDGRDGKDGKDGQDWDKNRNDNSWDKNDHSYKNTNGASAHASVRSFISANTNLIRIR